MIRPRSETLGDLIEELAERYSGRPAVSDARGTLTFKDVRNRSLALARALHADGVRSGDRVGILMGNRTEWLISNFAIQYLGATMVGLNTWYTDRELTYVLEHADVSVLFMAENYLKTNYAEMLQRSMSLADLPTLRTVVVLGSTGLPFALSSMVAFEEFCARASSSTISEVHALRTTVQSHDIAYLLYTSGSTAYPKGVLLRHAGLLENSWQIGERLHYDADDVLYLPISLFWGLGCENALPTSWQRGMHIVLQDHFDPTTGLELIEKYRCTAIYGTANIILALLNHPSRGSYDLRSLRKGASGGSPEISRRVIRDFIPGLCHPYGLTETYGYSAVNDANDPPERRATSDGRPLPGAEIWIVDPETNERLKPGEIGEIRQRGNVMAGYHKAPDVTAQSFDDAGFFKTGDLGLIDEAGYLYFKGRSKEMIRTGGMNVSPAEVEGVLKSNPAIEDAFVTGLKDPDRGEIVAALVVPIAGAKIDSDLVLAHCRGALAAYKVPRQTRFISFAELPLTTTGKVHRMRLSELFEHNSQASA